MLKNRILARAFHVTRELRYNGTVASNPVGLVTRQQSQQRVHLFKMVNLENICLENNS